MKKTPVIIMFICINTIFAILLIHKQNKIITLLYALQELQEQKENVLQEKKNLTFQLHKEEQLSTIQSFAQQHLQMSPLKIKDAKKIRIKDQHASI